MRWLSCWLLGDSESLSKLDGERRSVEREDEVLDTLDAPDVLDAPDALPTGLGVCHWCDGPASPLLHNCCVGCLEKLKWRAAMREHPGWNDLRIDFY